MSPNHSEIRSRSGAVGSARDALGRRARTLARGYRLQGLKGSLVLVASLLPDSVLSVEWFAVLETGPGPSNADRPDLEFRWGDEDDLPALAALRPPADVAERLRGGDRVLMALEEGGLVGFMWFSPGSWTEHAVTFPLRPDEVWGYDALVPAEHRGRRIYPAISDAASRGLDDEGIVRFLSATDHLNGPSAASDARRGARRLESVLVVGILGLGLMRRAPAGAGRPRWTRFRRAAGTTAVLPAMRGTAERE